MRISAGFLLLTSFTEVLVVPSFMGQVHVSPNAYGTQIKGRFTLTDMMQAEDANHNVAISSR